MTPSRIDRYFTGLSKPQPESEAMRAWSHTEGETLAASQDSHIAPIPHLATASNNDDERDWPEPDGTGHHLLLTVEQAARRLNVGRSTLYALLQTGRLESVTVGRLRRVPAEALSEFVESLRDDSKGADPNVRVVDDPDPRGGYA
jgi:excisionase family DNA binding protein